MKVKIKKLHPDAIIPSYIKKDDAGMDLVAISRVYDEAGNAVYGTGIAMEIPPGYVGLIFPRGNSFKKDLLLSNSVGVINPGCTQEITLKFKPSAYFATMQVDLTEGNVSDSFDFVCFGKEDVDEENNVAVYDIGDRIGQLVILPRPIVEWEEVIDFATTEVKFEPNSTAGPFQGSHLL